MLCRWWVLDAEICEFYWFSIRSRSVSCSREGAKQSVRHSNWHWRNIGGFCIEKSPNVQAVEAGAGSSSVCDPMQSGKGETLLPFQFSGDNNFEFRSQIFDSDDMEIASATTELSSVLHESIKFDVVGIDLPLAWVLFLSTLLSIEWHNLTSHLFRDMMLVNIHKKPSTITVLQSSLNPFAPAFEVPTQNGASSVDVSPTNGSSPMLRHENGVSGFTKEGLGVLFEQPLNTSNAMVAVTGYEPKDDARICKFYDPSTGKCFKGNSCKFEHVQIMKSKWMMISPRAYGIIIERKIHFTDGTTRDKCPAKMVEIHAKQMILNAHDIIDIIPLCVISVEEFYAYMACEPEEMNPKQLGALMNMPENRAKFKPIQSAPGTCAGGRLFQLQNHQSN